MAHLSSILYHATHQRRGVVAPATKPLVPPRSTLQTIVTENIMVGILWKTVVFIGSPNLCDLSVCPYLNKSIQERLFTLSLSPRSALAVCKKRLDLVFFETRAKTDRCVGGGVPHFYPITCDPFSPARLFLPSRRL